MNPHAAGLGLVQEQPGALVPEPAEEVGTELLLVHVGGEARRLGFGRQIVSPRDLFIVISGNASGERMLQAQLRHNNVNTSFIAANRLPATPVGYESIDVLLLNQPEIARLDDCSTMR